MRLFRVLIVLVGGLWAAPAFADMTDDTWHQVRSDNFQIFTNGDVKQVKALARDLELFRASVILFIGSRNVTSDIPFRIFAVGSRRDFLKFYDEKVARGLVTSGLFESTLRGNYAIVDLSVRTANVSGNATSAAEGILKHEYVHYILRANSRIRYPWWYEEGFAEYLSTLEYQKGEVRVGFPVAGWHYSLNDAAGQTRLEDVLRSTPWNKTVSERALYGQGWLLVHHLHDDPALAARVVPYLTEYNRTGDSLGAFNSVFQADLTELTRTLRRKAEKGKYSYRRIPLKVPLPEPNVTDALMPTTAARLELAAALRIFKKGKVKEEDIVVIYQQVLEAEPGNTRAIAALADMDMQQDRVASAESRLAAVPEGHDDVPMLIARGDLCTLKAFAAAQSPAELPADMLDRARAYYLAAAKQDNTSAEAFYSYGLTYMGADSDIGEGVAAMREASILVPSSAELMQYHAIMLLQAGAFDQAATLSTSAEQLTHSSSFRTFSQFATRLALDRNAEGGRALSFSYVKAMLGKRAREPDEDES